jgi:transcriptional regulator with XRE-family HTH domain
MEKIEIQVTKLHKILIQRGMTQKDFRELIIKTNNGKAPSIYILNELINGKRLNYNVDTIRQIKNALNVSYDELIED